MKELSRNYRVISIELGKRIEKAGLDQPLNRGVLATIAKYSLFPEMESILNLYEEVHLFQR
jgi:hypothetical protein